MSRRSVTWSPCAEPAGGPDYPRAAPGGVGCHAGTPLPTIPRGLSTFGQVILATRGWLATPVSARFDSAGRGRVRCGGSGLRVAAGRSPSPGPTWPPWPA